MNFRYKLMQFMQGRYGVDGMFYILIIIASVLAFINCFIFIMPIRTVIQLIVYAIIFYAFFRALSKNIEARSRENRFAMRYIDKIKKQIQTKRQRRADTSHIYRKCPSCKAVLRLPHRIGKHKTTCPKCGKEFKVTVRK